MLVGDQDHALARRGVGGDADGLPGGGNTRWEIVVGEDGASPSVATYDAGGTLIDSDSISPTFLSRWDNASQHLVVVRFGGGTMDVWFGGDTATLTATSGVYESDLICRPSDVICWWDEVTLWRRALADVEIASVPPPPALPRPVVRPGLHGPARVVARGGDRGDGRLDRPLAGADRRHRRLGFVSINAACAAR